MSLDARRPPANAGDRASGARGAKLLTLCLELGFSLLTGVAIYSWLGRWSVPGALVGACLGGGGVLSLGLFTLIWPDPLLRSLEEIADQYGARPADMVFWIYLPELLMLAGESCALLALAGRIAPVPVRAVLWISMQVLVLLPSLAKRRKKLGALLASRAQTRKVGM